MNVDKLRDSPIGQIVPINGSDSRFGTYEHWAFLPENLPDEPALSQHTWNAVARASEALGTLRQACSQLPNPKLLITPTLTREAMDTSALEGTYGALGDLLEARLPQSSVVSSPETREIRAYERMAETAFAWIRDRPITIGMLSELQSILAAESRNPVRDPGKVREHQVVIGPEGCSVFDARFIPPPPDDRLRSGLMAWERWIAEDHDLPIPVRVAMSHYQFETLHPFGDGNGRVGRLVMVLQMMKSGALPEPVLTLSPWLLRRRTTYQDMLLEISRTGDWNPWIGFFCAAVSDQCGVLVGAVDAIQNWMSQTRQAIAARHWTGVITRIADDLIAWPAVNINFIMENYGVSQPTAQNAVDHLIEIGALRELTGRSYARMWGAMDVIRIVENL